MYATRQTPVRRRTQVKFLAERQRTAENEYEYEYHTMETKNSTYAMENVAFPLT